MLPSADDDHDEAILGSNFTVIENLWKTLHSKYLKITEKVSFNIASKTSNVYILSRQK